MEKEDVGIIVSSCGVDGVSHPAAGRASALSCDEVGESCWESAASHLERSAQDSGPPLRASSSWKKACFMSSSSESVAGMVASESGALNALGFTLVHYAGEVVYDATGFLEKNKDRGPVDALPLLRASNCALVRVAFAPTKAEQAAMSAKKGARFAGVVAKFSTQLGELSKHLK